MCSVKTPSVSTTTTDTDTEYLHNPFLDDTRNAASDALALRAGRSTLRIPLTSQNPDVGFGGRTTTSGGSAQSGSNSSSGLPSIRVASDTSTGSYAGSGRYIKSPDAPIAKH